MEYFDEEDEVAFTEEYAPWKTAPTDVIFYEKVFADGHFGQFTEDAQTAYKMGWLNNTHPKDDIQTSDINGWTYIKSECPMKTEEDLAKDVARADIQKLKKNLADTDYQAIKYAEGLISDEDYEDIGRQRQQWRKQINELEAKYLAG